MGANPLHLGLALVLVMLLAAVQGCAAVNQLDDTVRPQVAAANDSALTTAEGVVCGDLSLNAYQRRYAPRPQQFLRWLEFCQHEAFRDALLESITAPQ